VEALLLIKKVVQSGRSIIGFDLNEVSPGVDNLSTSAIADTAAQWDANVGARLLYKLCGWVLK
jgi:agmatinase